MNILIQNSRGELLTVAIQATDTFDSLRERMLVEYGLHMEFENVIDQGNENINTKDKILDSLKRNNQRPAVKASYPRHSQFISEKYNAGGSSATSVSGTIILEPRAAQPEEIYASDDEGLPERMGTDEPMETTEQDPSSLCRLCAIENHEMIPIFGTNDNGSQIVERIRECFSIVVSKNDVAINICTRCHESLQKFGEFRKNVMRANEKFESLKNNRTNCRRPKTNSFVRRLCTVCNQVLHDDETATSVGHCHANCNGEVVEMTLNSMYKCEFCQLCYSDVSSLKKHQSSHVGETPYICLTCNMTYATYNDITTHCKNEHGESSFDTNNGDSTCIPKYLICRYCDGTFAHFEDMNVHRKFCKIETDCRCSSCGLSFDNFNKLASHTKGEDIDQDDKRKWQCQDCDSSFGSKCALNIHGEKHDQRTMNIDDGSRVFACEYCGKHFIKRKYLNNHAMIHTGERPFKCSTCDKGFINLARLSEHKKVYHTDEKHYKCKFCDKAFKRPNARKSHMAIHTGEKFYNCDICNGTFRRNGDLKKHKKIIHHIESPLAH